jgi:hypothetical protein
MEGSPQLRGVGGIAYYMSPPQALKETPSAPPSTSLSCALFSKTWIKVSAKQLKDQQMVRIYRMF